MRPELASTPWANVLIGAESHLRNLNIAVLRQRVPVNF